MDRKNKKLRNALKILAKEFESELPPIYIEKLFKEKQINEQQIYDDLANRQYEWKQGEWRRPTPNWIKDAINQFDSDLKGAYKIQSPFSIREYSRFPIFHDYLKVMEDFIETEISVREKEWQRVSEESEPDEWNNLPPEWELITQHLQSAESFYDLLRVSFFINLISYTELFLTDRFKGKPPRNSVIKSITSDLVGPLIEKLPGWKDIQIYLHIRNCLVHEDGFLDDSDKANVMRNNEIRQYVSKTNSLKIIYVINVYSGKEEFEKVALTKEFCIEALSKLEDFALAVEFVAQKLGKFESSRKTAHLE